MINRPKLRDFFKIFFHIWLTWYGWPAVLWQMKNSFVHKKKWISEKDFMEALSISQILPGATGVTLSWYLWFRFFGVLWAIAMSFAYVFPPFVLIVVLSYFYFQFWTLSFVQSVMKWLWALVVALIFNAIFQLWWGVFKKISIKDYKWFIIMIFAFLVAFFFKEINIIFVIFGCWVLAFLLYYFTWEFENVDNSKQEVKEEKIELSVIKDLQSKRKNKDYYILGILWIIIGWISLFPTTRNIFYQFFLIGSFAFGWGFTTIPMIQHQIVNILHWLPIEQFRDGIALWQITPGSFLISSSFIGYKVYGIVWAIVATLGIFSPPIILITALSKVHTKIKELRIFRIITKWFITWFLWILTSTLISFWENSLITYKAWIVFIGVFVWVRFIKKDPIWAILATIIVSLFIF